MISMWWCLLFSATVVLSPAFTAAFPSIDDDGSVRTLAISEEEMAKILKEYDTKSAESSNRVGLASWAVATDVGNKEKEEQLTKEVEENAKFVREWYDKYWKDAKESDYQDESIRRQLHSLKQIGTAVLTSDKLNLLTNTVTRMTSIYNSATVCPYTNQTCAEDDPNRLTLDPHITARFAKSRDFDELKYLWVKWHDATGPKMRSSYKTYVDLMNEVGKGNGFANNADFWKDAFEDPKFEEHVDALWLKVKPLYDELHNYMRLKLRAIYGDKIDPTNKNIPAHLLGNMWAQSWQNLFEETKPFKNGITVDVTKKLKELKYDAFKMFETSNDFYMSLGLPTNKMSYTGKSIITKPNNVTIQCHASAWDFSDGKDFRIKMCTNINHEDLIVIHHEMGHIQYYIQYKDLPNVFRTGANPGFHEAIGDTIALSVANPRHLVKIGLLDEFIDSKENNINALYMEALGRVAFLPFGLLIDKWRWDAFSGKVSADNWNAHWWKLRQQYQKVIPPVERTESAFDPGAKFHVPADSQYISYFISHILEFSFYKSLCIEAGEYDPKDSTRPLHACDFYKSKAAGKRLADGLKLGGSKHWSEALKTITGETELSADAILEYFKPLREVLVQETQRMYQEYEKRQKL